MDPADLPHQDEPEIPVRERRRVNLEWLGWQLGRLDEKLVAVAESTERGWARVEERLADHDQRIASLETEVVARQRAEAAAAAAAAEARKSVIEQEDRFGKFSPRALAVGGLAIGAAAASIFLRFPGVG